jgi:hypothetical protein
MRFQNREAKKKKELKIVKSESCDIVHVGVCIWECTLPNFSSIIWMPSHIYWPCMLRSGVLCGSRKQGTLRDISFRVLTALSTGIELIPIQNQDEEDKLTFQPGPKVL